MDVFADTGVKSLRLNHFLNQYDGVKKITMVEPFENFNYVAPLNLTLNNMDFAYNTIEDYSTNNDNVFELINENALDVMYSKSLEGEKYDFIEIDAKGSA